MRKHNWDDFCLVIECRATPRRKVRSRPRCIAFGVTSAIEPSTAAIKDTIELKFEKGEYLVGEHVSEQKMKRLVIENGEVTASEVAVASNARPAVQTSIRANT